MDPRYIAQVAHAACRSHAAIHGEAPRPEWNSLDGWQRTALIHQVRTVLENPSCSAEVLHAAYCYSRRDDGWTLGASFDRAAKHDPLLRPWAELHRFTRTQDELVLGVVRALAPDVAAGAAR